MADPALADREAWDDSELVDSWNQALEEYKKYHSIAAKREDLNELIQKAEKEEMAPHPNTKPLVNRDVDQQMSEAQAANVVTLTSETSQLPGARLPGHSGDMTAFTPQHDAQQDGRPVPEALMATVQDENMRNLMISWYYAGYYTGYLEGQQKAYKDANTHQQIQH
ncbi:Survival motor neuron-like protein 1 [Sphaceloma murrayae]|uniref:Survival motor neuron-like protein 1 n=1 Tax=Sphaceloma murrayae TaxID=2082308 RepID=A0A2K1QH18_9PEZI|nr:Survival motor neuron-like protein 1 [Sphaceloma murrayae]